jgi:hypothetical protein
MPGIVRSNALPLSIGALAIAIATTGTAVAATGSKVNITDPTHTARMAKVTSTGRLMTSTQVTGTVASKPPVPFADSMSVSSPAGTTTCGDVDLANGRRVRVESITVSVPSSNLPTTWLRSWSESTEGGAGFAFDMRVPLSTTNSDFYTFGGTSVIDYLLQGGSEFDANGIPARASVCVRAPDASSTSARFVLTGVYIDK